MFTATPGAISGMEDKAPIDFFRLFFDGQVLDLIHSETRRYVDQYLESKREHLQQHPKARAHEWRRAPLLLKEVEVFLALIIGMGICGFPTLRYSILHDTCTNIDTAIPYCVSHGHTSIHMLIQYIYHMQFVFVCLCICCTHPDTNNYTVRMPVDVHKHVNILLW